jgi:hypothetical protein
VKCKTAGDGESGLQEQADNYNDEENGESDCNALGVAKAPLLIDPFCNNVAQDSG